MKTSDLLNKVAGIGLLSFSAALGILSSLSVISDALIPGLFFGISGLVLLTRRDQTSASLPSDIVQRLERIEQTMIAQQQDLTIAQDELRKLTEEREFLRQLKQ